MPTGDGVPVILVLYDGTPLGSHRGRDKDTRPGILTSDVSVCAIHGRSQALRAESCQPGGLHDSGLPYEGSRRVVHRLHRRYGTAWCTCIRTRGLVVWEREGGKENMER